MAALIRKMIGLEGESHEGPMSKKRRNPTTQT